nr:uncharacterized protein LOC104103151 [Nicotiana tomentosiformis]
MSGLDPKVAFHHLAIKNGARPVKLAQRRFRLDLVPLIESEVNKLIEDSFISEVKYPTWVSNEELTAFRTPKGIYYYKVMPFGLKNGGATYQRAMQNIFDDLRHKNVERYADDWVILGSYEVKKPELRAYQDYAK